MANYILQYLDDKMLQEMANNVNELSAGIKSGTVKVTDEEKIGVRTMAEGREGYARLVSKVATQHAQSLSREDDPKELERALYYDVSLETARQAVLQLAEQIADTQWGNSADVMVWVDRFAKTLQAQRGNNGALDNALREIDEYNSRFGRSNNTPPTPQS